VRKIAVLVSGRGSNLMALHRAVKEGLLDASIDLVISNMRKAPALDYCRDNDLEYVVIKKKDFQDREAYFDHVGNIADQRGIDLIVLAGFMLLVSRDFVERFWGKLINIHPALLPSFPGLDANKQVFEHGVKVTGCTVFFVDDGCDTGPIIAQKCVPVLEDDTLKSMSERVLKAEHDTLWRACKLILEDKVKIEDRRKVVITEDK